MGPTYKILPSYDHLIDKALGTVMWDKHGDLSKITDKIVEITNKYNYQVKNLAAHLKGATKLETCYNNWHFVKNNIKYAYDHPGIEQLRTPARTWSERFTGLDCDDYSIFLASLLINQGYSPTFHVVAFKNNSEYSHIFVVLDGIIMDDVWRSFNEYPPNITKTMRIQALAGLSGVTMIRGLGAIAPANDVTRQLQDHQTRILKAMRERRGNPVQLRKELRKVRLGIVLNGLDEQAEVMAIMPHIDDISAEGHYIFKKGAPIGEIEEYLSGIADDEDQLQDELAGIDEQYGDLEGLGRKSRAERKAKRAARKAKRKTKRVARRKKFKAKIKKLGKGIKKLAKKIGKGLIRFNPATITMRLGVLMVMRLNIKQWAGKLAIGYMTEAEARAKNYNVDTWRKLVSAKDKLEKAFKKMGGKVDQLKKAIQKGGKKGLKGYEGLGNLGIAPAVAAAAITAGLAFLGTTIGPLVGKIGKKDIAPEAAEGGEGGEAAEEPFGEEGTQEEFEKEAANAPASTAEEAGFANEEEQQTANNEIEKYEEAPDPTTDETETKTPEEVSDEEANPAELPEGGEAAAEDASGEEVEGLGRFGKRIFRHHKKVVRAIRKNKGKRLPGHRLMKHRRKLEAVMGLRGEPEAEHLMQIMPYVDDINDGEIIFKTDANIGAINEYLSGIIEDGLLEPDDDLGETDWSKIGEGAGNVIKSIFKSNPEKKAARKAKRAAKKSKKKKRKFNLTEAITKGKTLFAKGKKGITDFTEKINKKEKKEIPSYESSTTDAEGSKPDEEKKDNTLLYVGAAAVGLVAILMLTKKS